MLVPPLLEPPRALVPPELLPVVPPLLAPPDEVALDEEPPVMAEPPVRPPLPAEALELLELEPPWEDEDPPTAMLLPMALPGSLFPPVGWLELELELELEPPPPLPPLGELDADDDDEELVVSPLLCEGGAKAQPKRPLVARRAKMGGERNFMRVLLHCSRTRLGG